MNLFEITLQRQTHGQWPITVEHVRAGSLPVRAEGRLELDRTGLLERTTPEEYGLILGRSIFREDVRDAFARALAASQDRLHVLLSVEDSDLRTLRWERLCAPVDTRWQFLLLNQRTPFSLYLPSMTDRLFPPFGRHDLNVLLVAASPVDLDRYRLAPFDVAEAVRSVRTALGSIACDVLAAPGAVADAVGLPSLDALAARITAQPYTILHVICHGVYDWDRGETYLFLADQANQTQLIAASTLIDRLSTIQGVRGLPHLAFLATCDSAAPEAEGVLGGLGQRLVRDLGMPAVVAMTESVGLPTAQALAAGFYNRLREHGEVDRALSEATVSLHSQGDIVVPALFSRLGGRPLFSDELDRQPTSAEIETGLGQLEHLLDDRAPVLLPSFASAAALVRRTPAVEMDALFTTARDERADALQAINALCGQVLEFSFRALCFGRQPLPYDSRCPFPGLLAFKPEDRAFFKGREKLVEQLRTRLKEHGFLAITGPSGSGKSSVVLAGLIPSLQAQDPNLSIATLRPGSDPVAQLDAALERLLPPPSHSDEPAASVPAGSLRTLLVVDQFEELFTLAPDEAQCQAFVESLLVESQTRQVVITMRGDFVDDCAIYPQFHALLAARQLAIGFMTPAELRAAIEQQAEVVGLRFEVDLVNTILDAVAGQPGSMPLLQHGLRELWKRRHGRWLLAGEYRAMGGIEQAIARTADTVFLTLSSTEQPQARAIFLRLVRLNEDDPKRDTRRRVDFEGLVTGQTDRATAEHLVNRLADEKLLVISENPVGNRREVELAHEALIREWGRLHDWVAQSRSALQLRQTLDGTVREWIGLNQDTSVLYRGARLARAEAWLQEEPGAQNEQERAFLEASIAAREREAQEKERQHELELKLAKQQAETAIARAQAEARRARRLRLAVIILALALTIPLLLAARQLHRSLSPWQRVKTFPPNQVSVLAADPFAPVYCVGTSDVGLGCSRDGRHWNIYQQDFPTGAPGRDSGGMPNIAKGVTALAIDPTNPDRILLGVYEHGVFESDDGGRTMTSINNGLPTNGVVRLALAGRLILAAYDGRQDNALYAGQNDGQPWQRIGGTGTPLGRVYDVMASSDSDKVYAGTEHGVFSSPADGKWQWTQELALGPVRLLAPADGKSLFVLSWEPDRKQATLVRWQPGATPQQLATFDHQPRALTAGRITGGEIVTFVLSWNKKVYGVDENGHLKALGGFPDWFFFLPTHLALLAVPDPDSHRLNLWLGHQDGLFQYSGELDTMFGG